MHELGITQNIVAIVGEAAKGRRVHRVTLEVGEALGRDERRDRLLLRGCRTRRRARRRDARNPRDRGARPLR